MSAANDQAFEDQGSAHCRLAVGFKQSCKFCIDDNAVVAGISRSQRTAGDRRRAHGGEKVRRDSLHTRKLPDLGRVAGILIPPFFPRKDVGVARDPDGRDA